MGLFTKTKIPSDAIEKNGEDFFYPVGASASFSLGSLADSYRMDAFCHVPEVNAILNLRARAHGNIKFSVVDLRGNVTNKKVPLIETLNAPNYFQSKEEFFGQTQLFRDIFGNEIINLTIPIGMKKPIGIFSIPWQNIEVKSVGEQTGTGPFYLLTKLPNNIVYIYKDTDGVSYELNKDNLLHLNDNNVKFSTNKQAIEGMSRLDALQAPVENIKATYEARNVLIVNRGAIGILSNAAKDGIGGTSPMNKKEKARVQEEFKKYGLKKSQWQVIITNLALNWQQMAIDVDKLKLFEETREDTLKICDAFGTPYEMLSSIRNTTFDNKKEAQRQWYRDTIIPEANARLASINRKFGLINDGVRLIPDFSHLPIFEEEKKARAQSLLLTVNALTKALEDNAISLDTYKKELKKFGI